MVLDTFCVGLVAGCETCLLQVKLLDATLFVLGARLFLPANRELLTSDGTPAFLLPEMLDFRPVLPCDCTLEVLLALWLFSFSTATVLVQREKAAMDLLCSVLLALCLKLVV